MNERTADDVRAELGRLLANARIGLPELAKGGGGEPDGSIHLGSCSLASARRLAELLRRAPAAMPAEGTLVFDEDTRMVAVVAECVTQYVWLRLPDAEECRWQAEPSLVRLIAPSEIPGRGPAL
ncbi:hypothetical protein [Streptomyces mayteni]